MWMRRLFAVTLPYYVALFTIMRLRWRLAHDQREAFNRAFLHGVDREWFI